jgi:hypothetical protein
MPETFSSSSCVICGESEGAIEHLLYQCPLKLAVWQTIWEEHFPATIFSPMVVHNALFRLQFPQKHTQALSVPTSAIIAAIITSIWRVHWFAVFDAQPFLVNPILQSVRKLIHKTLHEALLSVKQAPRALPFICVD